MINTVSTAIKALAFGMDESAKPAKPSETVGVVGFMPKNHSSNPINSLSCNSSSSGTKLDCLG